MYLNILGEGLAFHLVEAAYCGVFVVQIGCFTHVQTLLVGTYEMYAIIFSASSLTLPCQLTGGEENVILSPITVSYKKLFSS